MLNLTLPDADVVKIFRALERNRTVLTLLLHYITFSNRNIQALGRLVANNRALMLVTVDLRYSDPEVDRMAQCRRICQELREALRRNCFMTSVNLYLGSGDHSNDPLIKQYFRRNTMLINQASRFVFGSMEKTYALAFETLKHNASMALSLKVHFDVPQESAVKMVAEARRRLAYDYFVLVGVVKSKIVCHRNRKAKKRKTLFDNMGRDLQARIFSYLSLTDVVDV
ncbi:hypothetical protein HPB50_000596 [Hyalomma asiaticum]|uniref:Uncharacterized protein n=1 Tax=Hyalomma asiaticum TaxID=266040 RepID=A0ACB7RGR6_HYAAI|nr:hypothetical protein HPB50_000596 [Hyalomma asiaticum]